MNDKIKKDVEDYFTKEELETLRIRMRKVIIEDVKKDTKALYFAFKYIDPSLGIITTDFLEELIEVKKFAIKYVPKDLITDKMIWILIRAKNPKYLLYVPRERITKEMQSEIINTYTLIGLQTYLRYMNDKLDIDTVKRIVLKTKKIYRKLLIKHIPPQFLNEEIRTLTDCDIYEYEKYMERCNKNYKQKYYHIDSLNNIF